MSSSAHRRGQGDAPGMHFRVLHRICLILAAAGGIAIFAVSLLVGLSVLMRSVGLGSIRGDFELVELVCITCASLFLPLCQYNRGHVLVDLFTNRMRESSRHRLDGVWTLLFAAAWAILCWRLSLGLLDMHDYGDRTMLLRAPLWWVYVPAIIGTGVSALVALLVAVPLLKGRDPDRELYS